MKNKTWKSEVYFKMVYLLIQKYHTFLRKSAVNESSLYKGRKLKELKKIIQNFETEPLFFPSKYKKIFFIFLHFKY